MKRFFIALALLAVILAGCTREPGTSQPIVPVAEPSAPASVVIAEPSSARPVPSESIAVPRQLPGVEDPEKGLFVIDPLEPKDYFDLSAMNMKRISRDRGELKEMTIVLRNIGHEPLTPIIRMTFSKADVKGGEATIEQDFPVPTIPSGMKLVKQFPVSILFSTIERDKTITLKFYKKFESPRSYYGTYTRTFKPIDELKDMEIKWL